MILLVACGNSGSHGHDARDRQRQLQPSERSSAAKFNDADVMFAEMMILNSGRQ